LATSSALAAHTRQRLSQFCKLRISSHEPDTWLQGELGEGVGIAKVVFLLEGRGTRGAIDVGRDDRDGQMPQLHFG
jgi:hypothetical protein